MREGEGEGRKGTILLLIATNLGCSSSTIADSDKNASGHFPTCSPLGPGLDALTVDDHFLPIHHDLGQPFITRPHAVREQLAQGQAAHTCLVHSEEAGLEARKDNRCMWCTAQNYSSLTCLAHHCTITNYSPLTCLAHHCTITNYSPLTCLAHHCTITNYSPLTCLAHHCTITNYSSLTCLAHHCTITNCSAGCPRGSGT